MGEHHDESAAERPENLPPDALPVPFLTVTAADPEPVIGAVNDAFERAFGDAVGTPVSEWAEARTPDPRTADTVGDALTTDDPAEPTVDLVPTAAAEPTRYRIRPIDHPTNGYLLSAVRDDPVAVDRLARVISHDLRNPLDVADAHLRAARETGDAEHFEQLAAAHDRMARIIQDVLTLARGEDALNPEAAVDLGAVAADAWATVDTGTATLSIADDPPRLTADPDRLQRLFENLFRNSIEHGSTSNRTAVDNSLTVTVGRDGEGFFVADDGVGIPAADRRQVFDSGYVSGDTGGGTGLGLTIVEEIADAHDWRIELTESEAGGVRFAFHPRSEASAT